MTGTLPTPSSVSTPSTPSGGPLGVARIKIAGLGLSAVIGGTTGVSAMLSRDLGRGVSCLVGIRGVEPEGKGGKGELCMWGPARRMLWAAAEAGVAWEVDW